MPKKSSKKTANAKTKKQQFLQLFIWLLSLVVLYWIFFVKLPSEVNLSDVWATISSLTLGENTLLLLAGSLTIIAVGWTAATVLPGLKVRKATQASVVGQMTSVALPPPLDMVIRFTMYKSYGFPVDRSAVAVVVAGIARYFTVVAMPLIGLMALLLFGQGSQSYALWLVGVGALFLIALWLMHLILSSDKTALKVGYLFEHVVNFFRKLIRKKPVKTLHNDIVDFGDRTKTVAIGNFWPIAISNIMWGFSCYLVFLLAVRFCGIDSDTMSAAYLLLVTGLILLFNTIPLTPGGIGVTETILLSIMTFPNTEVESAFAAALFAYRLYTWLLPMPVGVAAYIQWRIQQSKKPMHV